MNNLSNRKQATIATTTANVNTHYCIMNMLINVHYYITACNNVHIYIALANRVIYYTAIASHMSTILS